MVGTMEETVAWWRAAVAQKLDLEYLGVRMRVAPTSRVVLAKVVELVWCKGRTRKKRSLWVKRIQSAIDSALANRLVKVRRTAWGRAVVPDVKRIKQSWSNAGGWRLNDE